MGSVADFYTGKCLLITGATGFMGKVLIEKLLRSCPGIASIYLLMRPKGTMDVRTRLDELFRSKMFEQLRASSPEVLNKLHPVQGDITLPFLGLSEAARQELMNNVNVVFHAAATVKFDEALKLSLKMNVMGTKQIIELCHKMEKLEAVIHVSTAYCNCDQNEVKEMVYPPPMDPYRLIQLVDWMDDDAFNLLTPKLIGNRPNTYTYTKALAEHVLIQEAGDLPIAIVRPSIVTAAWREPLPGWVDNLNGPTGLIVGGGKGVLRTLYCKGDMAADIIPVDIPINLLIVSAWYTATQRRKEMIIYNSVSGMDHPITWDDVSVYATSAVRKYAMNDVLWYPSLRFTPHKRVNTLAALLKHWLPAYIMDMAAKLAGKKPIMVRIAQKLTRATTSLEYFTTRQWKFYNDNVQDLWAKLSESDQRRFNFSLSELHWPTYMEQYCLGAKQYVLKEELDTLPKAQKHLNKMWWLQEGLRIACVLMILLFVLFLFWDSGDSTQERNLTKAHNVVVSPGIVNGSCYNDTDVGADALLRYMCRVSES